MDYTLNTVRIFVSDWQQAVAFYADTLGMECVFQSAEMGWAQFAAGTATLGIERVLPGDSEGAELVGRFVGVSLEVTDIEVTHETLSNRGVRFTSPPQRQPWGGVLAHFEDPSGNVLTLLGAPLDSDT